MATERTETIDDAGARPGSSTERREQAKSTITRTTITPAPGTEATPSEKKARERSGRSLSDRLRRPHHGELSSAQPPFHGTHVLRLVLSVLLSALCLLTVGGAVLMLLLWQQDKASGVLTSQLDRTWDLFDTLRRVERWMAFAVVPVAVAWIGLAVINVRRAAGQRRNPIVAALSLPVGLAGVWLVGSQIIAEANDWIGEVAGFVLQLVFLAIPLLALERVATAAEARHRPLRATYIMSALYLAHLTFLGTLSTTEQTTEPDDWPRLGAYLVIAALLQVLGTLSANEAARATEEGTEHRYQLRHRFGESLLAQAEHR